MKPAPPSKSKRRCAEEVAYLDLLRTTDMLSRGPSQALKTEDLSSAQYNVLRILRVNQQPAANAENVGPMSLNELRKGTLIAARDKPLEKLAVRRRPFRA